MTQGTVSIRSVTILGAVALGAIALAGCSSSASHDTHSASPTVSQAGYNAADIEFAQMMIPHHEQAIEMAQLAPGRTSNREVLTLATQIEAAQGPEIETMQSWLQQWGAPTTAPTGSADAHGGHGGTGETASEHGMMTAEQMAALTAAKGPEYDRLWLEMMIEHHEGAVVMAQQEIAKGSNPQAKAMAQQIINTQNAEIAEMKKLLAA